MGGGGEIRSGLCICCINYTGVGRFYLLLAKKITFIYDPWTPIMYRGPYMIYNLHQDVDLMKRHFLTRNICA